MTAEPRAWLVAGAILLQGDHLLLVQNRRRNGSLDWSPPGGVVDEGEDVLGGLQREVVEETGLIVSEWSAPRYSIHATAPDMGWDLRVEAHEAIAFEGKLVLDDPDGIVVAAEWVPLSEVGPRLVGSPRWVREPLQEWLAAPGALPEPFRYRVNGAGAADISVIRDQ